MKNAILTAVILLLAFTACTKQARLYPIAGPLTENNTGVLVAEFADTWMGSGWLKLTLPSGELCRGEYTTLESGGIGVGTGSAFNKDTWMAHWGASYSRASTNRGTATLIGNKGSIIEIEYYTTFGSRGFGLGKDNKGNIYKIHF